MRFIVAIFFFVNLQGVFGEDKVFIEKPDSFFVSIADLVDSSKPMIVLHKDGSDYAHRRVQSGAIKDKSYLSPEILFYNDSELKGEVIAKLKWNYELRYFHEFTVGGKPLCSKDELEKVKKTGKFFDSPPVNKYRIYCNNDFYMSRSDENEGSSALLYNVEVLDRDKGVFSVTHNGKKLYAEYKFLKWDLVDSIDAQRKKFDSCLDKMLSLGYLKYAKKAQDCVKKNLKEDKKFQWKGWCHDKNLVVKSYLRKDYQDDVAKELGLEFSKDVSASAKQEIINKKILEIISNLDLKKNVDVVECRENNVKWLFRIYMGENSPKYRECHLLNVEFDKQERSPIVKFNFCE